MTMLAWLYWDPQRDIFTVPLINRPIAYYGLLFVLGFVIAYFIISRMFKRKLNQTSTLSQRDIASWPALLKSLRGAVENRKNPLQIVLQRLSPKDKEEITKLKMEQDVEPSLKKKIFEILNSILDDPSLNINRTQLEKLLPKGLYTLNDLSIQLADRLTWFVVIGTIVGARLGHVLFYDWDRYQHHPLDILKVWEGGLASHGGALGVMLALYIYQRSIRSRFPELTFITLLDIIVVPTALVAVFIRIGNFFNQEILGTPSQVPWAVIFGHPADGSAPEPRHPAQLYEGAFYLITFIILAIWWHLKAEKLRPGLLSGTFFILVFGSRFLLEFWKEHQCTLIDESCFQMGQYLSLPFVLLGVYLIYHAIKKGTGYTGSQAAG